MVKFLKTIGLALFILIGLFFLIQLIPTSSIEVYSKIDQPAEKPAKDGSASGGKETTIFKALSWLTSAQKNKSTGKNILLLGRPGSGYPGQDLTLSLIHI